MAGSFKLAEAYVELSAKGNLAQELQKQRDRIMALQKAARSGELGKFFREQEAINKAMQAFRAPAEIAAERMQKFQQNMANAMKAATVVSAGGAAAISGFVAAASPAAFETVALSFKLLSGEIGEIFIPYVAKAAMWIQRTARWFRELSAEQKDGIAKWTLWAVGIAGVVVIAGKVIPILLSILSLGKQIAMTALFNPWVAGATILLSSLGLVLLRLHELRQRAKDMDRLTSGKLGVADFDSDIAKRIEGAAPGKEAEVAAQEAADARAEAEAATKAFDDLNAAQKVGAEAFANDAGEAGSPVEVRRRMLEANRREALAERLAEETGKGRSIKTLRAQASGGGLQEALMSFKGMPQPAFTGFEDIGKQIQLAALKPEGSLEAQIMKDQLKRLDLLIDEVRRLQPAIG